MTVKDYVTVCARVYFGTGSVWHFLSGIFDLEELHMLKRGYWNGLNCCRLDCRLGCHLA